MTISNEENKLKEEIFHLVRRYYQIKHRIKSFEPGDYIPFAGRVFDENEIINAVDAALEFWLTAGKYSQLFEEKLSKFLGVKYVSLTNSGSSANLLAFMALTSPKLGERRIKPGDEVITVAASFPTTVNPIIQYGAVPVFVDISIPTYNIDVEQMKKALSKKTKAVMVAHTLGNPFDLKEVKQFCDDNGLWLIEDNCDALGSKYFLDGEWKYTGTIGDLGTLSFYPAHHITTGEGGAVITNNITLKRIVDSFRDWGRDCWCAPGKDNSCGKRFSQQHGDLPFGYDHKYVYSHLGYNLKMTDLQAAIGVAQMDKLDYFIQKRKENWKLLKEGLNDLEEYFVLPEPTENSDPSWFGFMITIRDKKKLTRKYLVEKLENCGIQTRMLFGGNLLRQPCFIELKVEKEYKVVGDLVNTNYVMNNSFWIGVYPGITEEMIKYIVQQIKKII
ncbi:lipopolysaccharide biosynthesis protein RfbH [Carboxydothermus pertinax]|uniref:dTDP-4-amino-4,6-dideoxygalactose transaminase n=1 Tax=Carboxydothermus pertinax TaxID=870242 RepID=A0A1L8CUS3_9THEO|nr:lipopolysaccharide biosynthesis protein RfbH [Carboxydothermus pertinax]GAV22604.1 dTDP-4-amino-4,6-dideoxygalactose transaminase [Carboxydothermus pertinax]